MSADHLDRLPTTAAGSPLPRYDDKPAAAVKVLGATLRSLRRERGLAIKDVAPQIRASISKISRMERGESPPRERDVLDLVRFYGVDDPENLREIKELLKHAAASAWWHQYSDVTPGWLRRLIGLEDSAMEIRTYEVHVVPGLLQTEDYARAVVKAGLPHADESEIARRVGLRMARQRLLHSDSRPRVLALLDEGILRRPVGGPHVMAAQLRHLRTSAESAGINIRVIRFEKAASITPPSSVTHLKFAAGGPSELIYLEQVNSALYLSREADVESYRHVLDELAFAAEPRTDSMALLDEAADGFLRGRSG